MDDGAAKFVFVHTLEFSIGHLKQTNRQFKRRGEDKLRPSITHSVKRDLPSKKLPRKSPLVVVAERGMERGVSP